MLCVPAHVVARRRMHCYKLPRALCNALSMRLTQCEQLVELLELMPHTGTNERVEACCIFWARTVDRATQWFRVMRRLSEAHQALLIQRLGACTLFNPKRPKGHYLLRLFRPDEHEVAWQLFNLAVHADMDCFKNLTVNGLLTDIKHSPSDWMVLRGGAKAGTVPSCTVEFDFAWPDSCPKLEAHVDDALKDGLSYTREQAQLVQAAFAKGLEVRLPASSKAVANAGTSRLLAVPLRKGLLNPRPNSSGGGVGPCQIPGRRKPTAEEREEAEGVVLRQDGRLMRVASRAACQDTFFNREVSGQASRVAAVALSASTELPENLGMFGKYCLARSVRGWLKDYASCHTLLSSCQGRATVCIQGQQSQSSDVAHL